MGEMEVASSLMLSSAEPLSSPKSLQRQDYGTVEATEQQQEHATETSAASSLSSSSSAGSADTKLALKAYRQALVLYRNEYRHAMKTNDNSKSILHKCNAAATLYNLGILHKECLEFEKALSCWEEVEHLYRQCIETAALIEEKGESPSNDDDDDDAAHCICLPLLLAETMQSRASLHAKNLQNPTAAIECYQQICSVLVLHLDSSHAQPKRLDCAVVVRTVPTSEERVRTQSWTLHKLGALYKDQGQTAAAVEAWEEALEVLQQQPEEEEEEKQQQLRDADKDLLASILMSVASLYIEEESGLEKAIERLRMCMEMRGEWSHPDVMACMNNMGLAYERMGDLGKALDCYQQLLRLRRKTLGPRHLGVAESCMTVASVLERRGEREGALAKYKEALDIYQSGASPSDQKAFERMTRSLTRVAILLNEQGSVDEAIASYQRVIWMRSSGGETKESSVDEATVFLRLADAFAKKGSVDAAKGCIEETQQLLSSIPDQDDGAVVRLLEEAHALQHRLEPDAVSSQGAHALQHKLEPDAVSSQGANALQHKLEPDAVSSQGASLEDPPGIGPDTSLETDSCDDRSLADPAGILFLPSSKSSDDLFPGAAGNDADDESDRLEYSMHPQEKGQQVQHQPKPVVALVNNIAVVDSAYDSSIEMKCIQFQRAQSTPSSAPTVPTSDESNTSESDSIVEREPGDPELTVSFLEELEDSDDEKDCAERSLHSQQESVHSAKEGSVGDVLSTMAPPNHPTEEDENLELAQSGGTTESTEPSTEEGQDDADSMASPISSPPRFEGSANVDTKESEISVNEISYTEFGHRSCASDGGEESRTTFRLADDETSEYTSYGDDEYDSEGCSTDLEGTRISDIEPEGYPFTSPLGLKQKSFTDEQGFVESPPIPKPQDEGGVLETREMLRSDLPPPRKPPSASSSSPRRSPRQRLVKVLSRTFRRRRSSRPSQLLTTPEDEEVLEETREPLLSPSRQFEPDVDQDCESVESSQLGKPISFVKMKTMSFDDAMSQITIKSEDFSRKSQGSVAGENEKWWFPAEYVARTVEDFLSAKSIHRQIQSHGSDLTNSFDDNDSDPFDDLSDEDDASIESDQDAEATKREARPEQLEEGMEVPLEASLVSADALSIQDAGSLPNDRPGEFNEDGTISMLPSTTEEDKKPPSTPARIDSRIAALKKTVQSQKDSLGRQHPKVASTLVALSTAQADCGRVDDAIETVLEAIMLHRDFNRPWELAQSLHMLADMYCRQEEYEESMACYNDLVRLERLLHGPNHPAIANTLNKIGHVFAEQGMFYSALEKHLQALQILKVCFGEDLSHPGVAQTLIHIGEVYYRERNHLSTIRSNANDYRTFIATGMLDVIAQAHEDQGTYKMALSFLEEKLQVINSGETQVTQEEMVLTLNNLGTLSCKAGVFLEAIGYYEQALRIQLEVGCDEIQIATAKVLTGTVEFHLGQYKKATGLFESALDALVGALGRQHEIVADTLQRLGMVEECLWDHEAALDHLQDALSIQQELLGKDDIAALKTRLEIARVMLNQFRIEEASAELKDVRRVQETIFGQSHPVVADTLHLIGESYRLGGELSKSMSYFRASFNMRERFLGKDHPAQAATLHRMALLQLTKNRNKAALQVCKTVLTIRRETLGESHIDVATTLCTLGRCYAGLGKLTDSTRSFKEALPMAEAAVEGSHPAVGQIHVSKGVLHLRKCQFDAAKGSIGKGIDIYKSARVDALHPMMKEAQELLERVDRDEMLCV